MSVRSLLSILLIVAVLLPRAALAQGGGDPNGTPVAVISLVWGVVTIKHQNEDYKPARWLEPVFAGDLLKTSGTGSKLLITYFFNNHQEVLGPDSVATAEKAGLTLVSGDPIRKDKARNPFSTGGVQNPFVYTHRLVTVDFSDAADPKAESGYLGARFDPAHLQFSWPAVKGAQNYHLTITDASGATVVVMDSKTPTCILKRKKAEKLFTGTVYHCGVKTDNGIVFPPRPFLYLSRPLQKWYAESRLKFDTLRKRNQLQRSDYTDLILVCSQLSRVDDVITLAREIAAMDGKNPRVLRALTRAYLAAGCPGLAKQAHDKEIELGGYDPIFP